MCAKTMRRRLTTALIACSGLVSLMTGCNSMNGVVMNDSGRAYYERGNYTMARQEFQRAIADDPDNADYIANLAATMKKSGDFAGAEQTYRHAMSVDPEHQPSYHGLAQMMHEQGRSAEAHDMLDTWAFTQPYNASPHVELAWLSRETGDRAGAEKSLQHALKINPKHPTALANLGQVYQDQGRPQQAMAYYKRSLNSAWRQKDVQKRLAGLENQYTPNPRRRQIVQNGATGQPMVVHRFQMPTVAAPTVVAQPGPVINGPQLGAVPSPVTGVPTPVVAGSPQPTPAIQLAQPVFEDPDPAHAPRISSDYPLVEAQ